DDGLGVGCARDEAEQDDVGVDGRRVDGDGVGGGQDLGEGPGVGVVGGQVVHVVVESVGGGGGEDAHLAHGPAEHAPVAAGPGDQVGGPRHHRPAGGAEALGERHPHDVERGGEA